MFLLVPAHPGCPGQIPQSRKTVVCVCVKVIYTNADGLLNKRQDLKVLIQCLPEPPDVITNTEFKPKKTSHQLLISEFNLDGYNVFQSGLDNNNDRGILFYIAYGIQASLVDIPSAFNGSPTGYEWEGLRVSRQAMHGKGSGSPDRL